MPRPKTLIEQVLDMIARIPLTDEVSPYQITSIVVEVLARLRVTEQRLGALLEDPVFRMMVAEHEKRLPLNAEMAAMKSTFNMRLDEARVARDMVHDLAYGPEPQPVELASKVHPKGWPVLTPAADSGNQK